MTSHPPKFPQHSQLLAREPQPSPPTPIPLPPREHTWPCPPQNLSTGLIGYQGCLMTLSLAELHRQCSPWEKRAVTAHVATSFSCYSFSCTLAAGTMQPTCRVLLFFLLLLLPGMWADPEGSCKLHIFQTFVFHNTNFVDTSAWATLEDIVFASLHKPTWDIQYLYPWVYPSLPAAEWDNLKNLFNVYMHNLILSLSGDAKQYQTPYPFVFQCATGCNLYPNGSYTKFYHLAYNTHSFLSFNVDNLLWERQQETELATQVERKFNTFTGFSETLQHLLNVTCVDHMKKFIKYGKASLKRQGETTLAHTPIPTHTLGPSSAPQVLPSPLGSYTPELPVATVFARTPRPDQLLLICHVTGFYPRPISVAWLQDGQEVPPGPALNTSAILPNADLTYQLRITLAVAPHDGHSYACCVRHRSLGTGSLLIPWGSSNIALSVGITITVLLTMAAVLAGAICHYRRRR
ncbi:antigen-presenting glycoprotein CD1d-like isoform X1 [Athene cunicularia]|uniref:antigen-presenting glycoprotein CD1d-like isoform X1 n=1 Tax=Athene cunicularia TaxID=194338 RepID=UPI000EF6C26F|nr:antigen-presenting glycoprotein CD1d-like isoform X1 [Athene cunicularia]